MHAGHGMVSTRKATDLRLVLLESALRETGSSRGVAPGRPLLGPVPPKGMEPSPEPKRISGPGGGGGGATTIGPDAPPPQLSVKTCVCGGGGSAGGWGGVLAAWRGGGAQPTTITCIPQGCVWGHGGIEVCMR